MVQQTSSNDTFTSDANKPTAAKKTYRFHFYDSSGNYANINIDPEIIKKLGLTEEDKIKQEVHGENILLRRFKETI